MSFEPCDQCRRHARTDNTACPFCGAAAPAKRRRVVLGRTSRSAVFASATLVGCWASSKPEPAHNTAERPRAANQAASTGVVDGVVTEGGSGPLANVKVTLMRGDVEWDYKGDKVAETHTDANGRYRFANVADGDYTVIVEAGRNSRRGWPRRRVAVPSREANGGDMVIDRWDSTTMPMPYGRRPHARCDSAPIGVSDRAKRAGHIREQSGHKGCKTLMCAG